MLAGPTPTTASRGRGSRIGLGNHDEPLLAEDPIAVRSGAAVGWVAWPWPGLPFPSIEEDVDDSCLAAAGDQGLKQFGSIPRHDDEPAHHFRTPHPSCYAHAPQTALTAAAGARRKSGGRPAGNRFRA